MASILGFVGLDGSGLSGIERLYDHVLEGEEGAWWSLRDAARREIWPVQARGIPSQEGGSVWLTFDLRLQGIVQSALAQALVESRSKRASALLMDPRSGELLAMATLPGFDPNRFIEYPPGRFGNPLVEEVFEPGSTFKPFVAALALDAGKALPEQKIFCEQGAWKLGYRTLHDHRPHGWLTFREVLIKSSNIGAAKIGLALGAEGMEGGLRRLGFGRPAGTGLSGEAAGNLRPPAQWKRESVRSVAMGHEISVTAVQMLSAFNVFANGGIRADPSVVREVHHRDGTITGLPASAPAEPFFSGETLRVMREILADVVRHGTGKRAGAWGVPVAGKTGTSQKINPDGSYSHEQFACLFVGFAPVEAPRLSVLVWIDEPRIPEPTGGRVAAPVAGRILARSLEVLGMEAPEMIPLFVQADGVRK
jgi:cell division protein FtsI (penicillin-binding protein 3)